MKRKITRYITLLVLVSFLISFCGGFSTGTISKSAFSNPPTKTTIKVVKVKYVKDQYSKWHRITEIKYAGRDTECGQFIEQIEKSIESSLELSVPISAVELSLGVTIKHSISQTFRGDVSAQLKKGEYTAYYYREHWKVYKVEEEVTTTSYPTNGRSFKPVVTKACKTEYIKIAQDLTSHDYGWFYAKSEKALKDNIDEKYCDDDRTCYVKPN